MLRDMASRWKGIALSAAIGCVPPEGPSHPDVELPSATTAPPIGIEASSVITVPKVAARISKSPFAFYRYVAGPFSTAVCEHFGERTVAMPTVSLHGDLHVEQYAVADDGFGIVDFDDATSGPPVVDWLRFGSSLWFATDFDDAASEAALARFIAGYRQGVAHPESVDTAPEPRVVSRVRSAFRGSALDWLDGVTSLIRPLDRVDEAMMLRAKRLYTDAMLAQNPELGERFFQLKAGGMLEMGVGSAHERKFLLRVEGPSLDVGDDLILEKKEMKKHLVGLCSRGRRSDPTRVVHAEEKFSRTPQRLLGYVVVDGSEFYVHTWRVHYTEISVSDLTSPGELSEVAFDMGLQLGRGHPLFPPSTEAGKLERAALLSSLDAVEPELTDAARNLAKRVVAGYERYRAQAR
jgi:uncharacterized protein (DUF2252 family)